MYEILKRLYNIKNGGDRPSNEWNEIVLLNKKIKENRKENEMKKTTHYYA